MGRKPTLYTLVLITLLSCTGDLKDDEIVASVYDANLYHSDITKASYNLSKEDSISLVKEFIKDWTNTQILAYHSRKNGNIDLDEIDYKAEQYRNMLLIHQFQNNEILKRLDTVITKKEIETYYNKHIKDFQLKDYLVKVIYVKVSEDAPDIDKLSKWYKLRKDEDIESIKKYVSLYATNFYYDEENWIYFDEITKEIPLQDINKDRFITRKSEIKFSENGYYYFLNIIDYKLKDAASPIEFEINNIKQRIRNTRIYNLREKINNELIQSAHEQNAIKIF